MIFKYFLTLYFLTSSLVYAMDQPSAAIPQQIKKELEVHIAHLGIHGLSEALRCHLPIHDLKDEEGHTVLMAFAAKGDIDAAQKLIAANANIDATDRHYWTALMYAAQQIQKDMVEHLINAGATIVLEEILDLNLLLEAANQENKEAQEIIALLLKKATVTNFNDPAYVERIWRSPILWRTREEATLKNIVLFLKKQGTDFNSPDTRGYTPLVYAITHAYNENNYLDITKVELCKVLVELLLAAGARIEQAQSKEIIRTCIKNTSYKNIPHVWQFSVIRLHRAIESLLLTHLLA